MTDEIILEGFKNLHQAMAEGFDRVDKRFDDLERRIDARFAAVDKRFAAVDKRFAEFDQRMMRRFDERDERLGGHERRITKLEAAR